MRRRVFFRIFRALINFIIYKIERLDACKDLKLLKFIELYETQLTAHFIIYKSDAINIQD